MPAKEIDSLTEAIIETAEGQYSLGLMDEATFRGILVRHFGERASQIPAPITIQKIRIMCVKLPGVPVSKVSG